MRGVLCTGLHFSASRIFDQAENSKEDFEPGESGIVRLIRRWFCLSQDRLELFSLDRETREGLLPFPGKML